MMANVKSRVSLLWTLSTASVLHQAFDMQVCEQWYVSLLATDLQSYNSCAWYDWYDDWYPSIGYKKQPDNFQIYSFLPYLNWNIIWIAAYANLLSQVGYIYSLFTFQFPWIKVGN